MFNSAVLRMNLPTRSSCVKHDERPRSHQPHLKIQELQLSKCRKTSSLSPAELLFHLNRSHVLNASIPQIMRKSSDALWQRSRHLQHLHKNARRWMAEFKMQSLCGPTTVSIQWEFLRLITKGHPTTQSHSIKNFSRCQSRWHRSSIVPSIVMVKVCEAFVSPRECPTASFPNGHLERVPHVFCQRRRYFGRPSTRVHGLPHGPFEVDRGVCAAEVSLTS